MSQGRGDYLEGSLKGFLSFSLQVDFKEPTIMIGVQSLRDRRLMKIDIYRSVDSLCELYT